MVEFNFKSQRATTIEQSERLIALGLRKETADMSHRYSNIGGNYEESVFPYSSILALKERMNKPILGRGWEELYGRDIPAWSLHRLIEMADTATYINEGKEDEHELWFCMDRCYCWNNHESFYATNLYDSIISCIEWLIKEGYFNNKYLCEK